MNPPLIVGEEECLTGKPLILPVRDPEDCILPGVVGAPNNPPTDPLLVGLVAWWKLDEATGSDALDATGNGHTAHLIQGAGARGTGILGNGLTNPHIPVPYQCLETSAPIDTRGDNAPFSIQIWYKADVNRQDNTIVGDWAGDFSIPNDDWKVTYNPVLIPYWVSYDSHGNVPDTLIALTQMVSGSWYHLVMTFDGTTKRIYVNGNLENSHTITNLPLTWQGIRRGLNSFTIDNDSSLVAWPSGTLDEIAYYYRAVSSAEVNRLFNSGNGFRPPGI